MRMYRGGSFNIYSLQKGTVGVISSDLHANWKCPIYNGTLESVVSSCMCTVYFNCVFSAKETIEKLSEMNTFRVSKTTLSFTFLIRPKFQIYRRKLSFAISNFFIFIIVLNCTMKKGS